MEKFRIRGGNPLKGRVSISGAKNSALPCMAAAILTGSNAIGQLANIGGQAWMMGYGRENEMEADRLGLKYMVKAGYDPESIGNVFAMFQAGEKFERARATAEGREPRLFGCHTLLDVLLRLALEVIADVGVEA